MYSMLCSKHRNNAIIPHNSKAYPVVQAPYTLDKLKTQYMGASVPFMNFDFLKQRHKHIICTAWNDHLINPLYT